MAGVRKIINDPVHGFITVDHPLLLDIIAHPFYQRLRRIYQMAFAHLVYPGAVHTRLHHSLGAYHLMCSALKELKSKNIVITDGEELGAKVAILLHDIGHGPFSHALEHELVRKIDHETISILTMKVLNEEFNGRLQTAIDIFTNNHPRRFLYQLISSQLDVDRMDYLTRDSFFTGVAEGVIGYDRILKMLMVKEDDLVVEEKAIYSIEKFLVPRRLMYWRVYLHKTVVCAEMISVNVIRRARELMSKGVPVPSASAAFDFFLQHAGGAALEENLELFCSLDDVDIMCAMKNWCQHPDLILSRLSRSLVDRKLPKIKLQNEPFSPDLIEPRKKEAMEKLKLTEAEAGYFVFTGETSNTTYNLADERINILFRDGSVRDISAVDNGLIHRHLGGTIKKYYFCHLRE